MRELVLGFTPIVVMWLLPLVPMAYAAVAESLDPHRLFTSPLLDELTP